MGSYQGRYQREVTYKQAKGEQVVREMKPETCIVRPADMFGEDDRLLTWYE